jgi:serine/threonine-protein phosphatase PGAM5
VAGTSFTGAFPSTPTDARPDPVAREDDRMARTLVYLVRHGEQSRDETGPDAGLSELGRRQARRLGERLRAVPFDAVHHSAAARATQTADEIAAFLPGTPVHACPYAADLTPVPAPGRAEQRTPQRYAEFLDAVPEPERDPGGVRVRATVEHWGRVGDVDRHELVVTHNFVSAGPSGTRWTRLTGDGSGSTSSTAG